MNQSDLFICDGQNITVQGTFYPDRLYMCVYCWDGDESFYQLGASVLPQANGTLLTCTIDLVPDAAHHTSTVDLYSIAEFEPTGLLSSNTTYVPGPSSSAYALGPYLCKEKKPFWQLWMTIVVASVGGALVVIGVFILRSSKSSSPERQPLRSNNADA